MSESESKPSKNALRLILDRVPVLLIIFGAALLLVAISTGVHFKDYQLAAESEFWRYFSVGLGLILIIGGVALHIFENPVEHGLSNDVYTKTGNYPLSISGPTEVYVIKPKQTFEVVGKSKRRVPAGCAVQLMHVSTNQLGTTTETEPKPRIGDDYVWSTKINCPNPLEMGGNQQRRVAFYFLGSHALELVNHHKALCRYFSPDGKPKWPTIDGTSK